MDAIPEDTKDQELKSLKTENDRLQAQFSLLSDLGGRIIFSLDLPTVLQEVNDASCELINAKYGDLAVFDDSGHILEFIAHGVTPE